MRRTALLTEEFSIDAGEMTQKELADRVGVTRQTILAIENGKYFPTLELAFRIARTFDVPLDEDFRAGTMAITWLPEQASLSVELYAMGSYHQLARLGRPAPGSNVLEVVITLDQARDFVARTEHLLDAHAPACPFCAQPIAATGHLCPRANGYRKPLIDHGQN